MISNCPTEISFEKLLRLFIDLTPLGFPVNLFLAIWLDFIQTSYVHNPLHTTEFQPSLVFFHFIAVLSPPFTLHRRGKVEILEVL